MDDDQAEPTVHLVLFWKNVWGDEYDSTSQVQCCLGALLAGVSLMIVMRTDSVVAIVRFFFLQYGGVCRPFHHECAYGWLHSRPYLACRMKILALLEPQL